MVSSSFFLPMRKNALCYTIIATILFLFITKHDESTNTLRRYLQHTTNEQKNQTLLLFNQTTKRTTPDPKLIYTFIQPMKNRKPAPFPLPPETERMITTWKKAWVQRGWEPRVLTLEDARRHPQFESLSRSINEIPLGDVPYYDRLCYIRYIAMAAVGGGFMSDYDTVPLLPPLDDWEQEVGDGFVIYDRHVPALVSGSKEEYERMIRLLVRNGLEKKEWGNVTFWSDMLALEELRYDDKENYYEWKRAVWAGSRVLLGEGIPRNVCNELEKSGIMGVHFSHWDVQNGMLPEGSVGRERSIVIRNWLRMYEEQCLQKIQTE